MPLSLRLASTSGNMKNVVLIAIVALCAAPFPALSATPQETATEIQKKADFHGGFVVHVGVTDGQLTAALKSDESTQVHGLSTQHDAVQNARDWIASKSKYGDVSVDLLAGKSLPYVDNLVNLIVVQNQSGISQEEIMRVLAPNGVACMKTKDGWNYTKKPKPTNTDEWSHYLHDATGNAVAHDDVVGPPRHLQWVGSPRWSRHHDRMASMSALVSTGGRMFYIMDEGSRISIQLPSKWKLIARDAYNGVILWKRDIPDWQDHLWPLKSGPTQLTRRLVSNDDTVFTTLGFKAPVSALDAVTGQTKHLFKGSEGTEEIINTGDVLLLVVRKGATELDRYTPMNGRTGDQRLVAQEFFWNEEPRVLMAFNAKTGNQLWAKKSRISPLTLASDAERAYFHDGEKLVAVDNQSGDIVWESKPVTRRNRFTFNFGPRLVIHNDVVLYAGGNGKMLGLDAATGKELWDATHPNSGYQSPQDIIVANGLVWCAPTTSGRDSGVLTGRDPRTGEVKKEFPPDVSTYWFHHRCYIAKATDKFMMPSRTGIEFVDYEKEKWDINHWVRGGCLYGVMPCNGLTYAPPHNCACYPEAKLYGFNALAPKAPTRPIPVNVPEAGRLEKGPDYSAPYSAAASDSDWPTYRHDNGRSGATPTDVPKKVKQSWSLKLGGRLTAPVIAGGQVFVAQVNAHRIVAISESTGKQNWTFTAGARIDSPPTISRGRVLFGCNDGWVYSLNAANGNLVWRYRAAPLDRRTMVYEQLESLWPVHGSVLLRGDVIYCVAGRSNFLDGGLRLLRLDFKTGKKISETIIDEKNPKTGNNLQEVLQVLQMPVGLPDILSADDLHVYMRSQKFDFEGNRLEIGPNSGEFAKQASVQKGPGAHLFAPMGFLDDTWFHRSYWVMGQSFAGGHGGYYQAGKFAPSGRILVNGGGYVFGYGRKPQYLRWTTTLEHQLFAASPDPPEIPKNFGKRGGKGGTTQAPATIPSSKSVNPAGKPITIEAWFTTTKPNGVIIARGGPADGFALTLTAGKPQFHVRAKGELTTISGQKRVVGGWHHVVGVLGADKSVTLYVDGQQAATGKSTGLLATDPVQSFDIGQDSATAVGNYRSPYPLTGIVDEVRLHFAEVSADAIAKRFEDNSELTDSPAVAISFDDGSARDRSTKQNHGTIHRGKVVQGHQGKGLQVSAGKAKKGKPTPAQDSLVKPKWAEDVPVYVRGMVLAGSNLFIIGPDDIIDEEETFAKLTEKDPAVHKLLNQQDAILNGKNGSRLISVDADSGQAVHELRIDSLPVWDGLAAANGKLYLTTLDGELRCFGE